MEKKNMIILSVFVLGVIAFALIFGNISEISGQVTKEMKGMSITSQPLGAKVYIDGKYVGITPLSDYKFPNEDINYGLRLVKDGYLDYVYTITPNRFNTGTFKAVLSTKNALGQLVISTIPTGANVYLDDEYVGTSLVTLANIPQGIHEIRLEKQGYPVYTEQMEVLAGKQNRYSKRMTPKADVDIL